MKQTILITGTSTGLGRATAKFFAAQGWNVVATMRRPEAEAELTRLDDVLVTRLDVQDLARGAIISVGQFFATSFQYRSQSSLARVVLS